MDDDTKAIAVGLGAGLGGFAGLLIVGCVCWQILCGTWCEKKKPVPSKMKPIPLKNQRRVGTTDTTTTKIHSTVATVSSTRNAYPGSISDSSSMDLASKVKSARR